MTVYLKLPHNKGWLFKHECDFMCVFFRFSWRYQLREFKSEFRVVAIDMRGYGESDLPLSTESYHFDYLVTDVKDIVEYLGEGHACLSSWRRKTLRAWTLFVSVLSQKETCLSVLSCGQPSGLPWQTSCDSFLPNMGHCVDPEPAACWLHPGASSRQSAHTSRH